MMKLLFGNRLTTKHFDQSVATIGNFDGVHLGHQALLAQLRAKAKEYALPAVVVLFEPQPSEFFLKNKAPARLTSLREKWLWLKKMQLDYVYCLRFNEILAAMSPEAFADRFIFSRLNAKWLLVGQDFRFGKNRAGDVNLLIKLGAQYGSTVVVVPEYVVGNYRVSSTLIRQYLAQNQLDKAALLLGRTYSLSGRVMYGQGLARLWGIPTANIRITRINPAISGIFCVRVYRYTTGETLQGVASLGTRPTVGGKEMMLEVNLFDFKDNLYGEFLEVSFVQRIRDEHRFASVDELVRAIHQDIEKANHYFHQELIE